MLPQGTLERFGPGDAVQAPEPALIPEVSDDLDQARVLEEAEDAQMELPVGLDKVLPVLRPGVGPVPLTESAQVIEVGDQRTLGDLRYRTDFEHRADLHDVIELFLVWAPDHEPAVAAHFYQTVLGEVVKCFSHWGDRDIQALGDRSDGVKGAGLEPTRHDLRPDDLAGLRPVALPVDCPFVVV